MKNRSYFKHRIDMLDGDGEILEHLAGVEDCVLADTLYESALAPGLICGILVSSKYAPTDMNRDSTPVCALRRHLPFGG
jgi:hypothetical protein